MSRGHTQCKLTGFCFYLRLLYLLLLTRETDCYTWHEQCSSHWRGCGPLGDTTALGSLSPESKLTPLKVLILSHVEAFPEAAAVSSVVKGATEISVRITKGRCCFKTAYMRVVNLRATATIALRAATFWG
jgi:hypothetical protein